MEDLNFISLLIGLAFGVILGLVVSRFLNRKNETDQGVERVVSSYEGQLQELRAKLDQENSDARERINDLASAQEKIKSLESHLEIQQSNFDNEKDSMQRHFNERLQIQEENLKKTKEQFSTEFKVLADRIFEDKSEKFTKQNKENLETFLNPLREKLKDFEDKVDKTYKEESKERISLKEEIKHLLELNQKLSTDANNLVSALKGESKVQGDWGEIQLEMILEKAGLEKNMHFSTQSSFTDEEGKRKRPDMIIHLPEEKSLIIDSKVSLVAYDNYIRSNDEAEKELYLKQHIESLKKHLKDLHGKKYQELYAINTPDYVLMFVPIEPALSLAIQSDQKLFMDALEKNVVLVSNSTLLATMKTVSFIWKQEDQKRNVLEIADRGAKLYDKFVNFTEDLIKVGKNLDQAKSGYEDAMKKLSTGRGNLIRRSEELKGLGLKTQKQLNNQLVERAKEGEQ